MAHKWLIAKSESNQLAGAMDIWDMMLLAGWTEADAWPYKSCAYSAIDTGGHTVTINSHGFVNGQQVLYHNINIPIHSAGTVIGGLTNNTAYYVVGVSANTFQLSLSVNGSAIDLSSQGTGTHMFTPWATIVGQAIAAASVDTTNDLFTLTSHGFINGMLVTYTTSGTVAAPLAQTALTASANITTATDRITLNGHGFVEGQMVLYSPTSWANQAGGLHAGAVYFVKWIDANTFQLSLTSGGAAIDITSQGSGNHTFAPLYFVVGVTGTTFQLSYTQGGAAIDLTSQGTGNHSLGGVEKTNYYIVCYNHGLTNGQLLSGSSAGTIPTGITAYTNYWVQNVQPHSFQLSSASTGAVSFAAINNGGTGGTYAVNDVLTLVLTGGATGSLKVISVSGGVVTGIILNAGGSTYSQQQAVPVTGGGGTGATFDIFCAGMLAVSTVGAGVHTLFEPGRIFSTTGEDSTLMARYFRIFRTSATAIMVHDWTYWYSFGHLGYAQSNVGISRPTTSESGFYLWVYANKNMVGIFSKINITYSGTFFGVLKRFWTTLTTSTVDATSGAHSQITVADNSQFCVGKKYQISGVNTGVNYEGRDQITIESLPAGKIQVTSLPRNYKSGAVIGETPGTMINLNSNNQFYSADGLAATGVVTNAGDYGPAYAVIDMVNVPDNRAEQRYLLSPWIVNDLAGVTINGILGYMDEYFLLTPTTGATQEDTFGVNPYDLTGAGVWTATSTGVGNDSTHLYDTGKAWSVNQFQGKVVIITAGTGAGQIRKIASSTATCLIPTNPFTTAPDNTSVYAICDEGYRYFTFYGHFFAIREEI